jgi:hypothetical protein
VQEHFAVLTQDVPLFTTDASGPSLWNLFLASLEPDRRQHYKCRACQQFVERFGGLAVIVDGRVRSALWSVPGLYVDGLGEAFAQLTRAVARSKITGVFLTKQLNLGTAVTGNWSHFSVQAASRHANRSETKNADQVMAEKRKDYEMLSRSFGDFSLSTVRTANELLASGRLYRAEKCVGVAKWLLDLYEARATERVEVGKPQWVTPASNTVTWLAVADAPAGFCHVRSGMIGTLLEDIETGLGFDAIKKRFDAKMDPSLYLRPQAPPSVGNIKQAEKIIEVLRTAGSLERRFAKLEEVDALWRPQLPPTREPKPNPHAPVFGHLLEAAQQHEGRVARAMTLPAVRMTWTKFAATVLPEAAHVEYQVTTMANSYCAIVTATNPEAPPIIQWDREDKRNPASAYVYRDGSMPAKWNLKPGWVKVNAFTLQPAQWYGNSRTQDGNGVIAILDGARDVGHLAGGGFFVEILRSEYHSIRSTLEEYMQRSEITGKSESTACGLSLSGSASSWSAASFRVTTTTGMVAAYNLDRWD